MSKPQFAILRFAKYKGPEISNIEAHNERTKEEYASNPDIDKSRSYLNFHLLELEQVYTFQTGQLKLFHLQNHIFILLPL